MSAHIKNKSEQHIVKHSFSGKAHFFSVKSVSGETYNVSIKLTCDCKYMGVQGITNKKICSHVLAVLKAISGQSNIKVVSEEK